MGFIIKKCLFWSYSVLAPIFISCPLTLADPHFNDPPLPRPLYVCELSSLIEIASTSCADEPSLQEQGGLPAAVLLKQATVVNPSSVKAPAWSSGRRYSLQTSDLDKMEWGERGLEAAGPSGSKQASRRSQSQWKILLPRLLLYAAAHPKAI